MNFFKNKNKIYIYYVWPIIGALLLLIVLFGYGIYRYHWQGPFIRRLSKIIPYPAIFVDWEVISYRAYLDDWGTLEKYWAAERENSRVLLGIPDRAEIRERLVNKLIEEKIVQLWARAQALAVLPEELEAEWQRLQTPGQSAVDVSLFLNKAYGWNEAKFKTRVLAPFLLEQKVKAALLRANQSDDGSLLKRAQEIYTKAMAPKANFSELAKADSDDRLSARAGGDLGYFSRGTFEPQLEKAIFDMSIGDISEPLKSSFGYHIFQLDDLLYDESGVPTQAAVRQILVKAFDFDDWLASQKNSLAIYRLVL